MNETSQLGNLTPDDVRAYPVLCVDDEPANLQVFRASFDETFTVLTASSGEEALAILERQPVAVLFVDHRMPRISGVDLCEITRRTHPDIKRVLVTAYAGREMAIDAINRGGVHHFLTKPWKWHEVLQLLHGLIATTHLQRMVHRLRVAMVEKERQVALAVTRRGYLHDLAGASGVLAINCDMVRTRVDELAEKIGPAYVRGLYQELDRMTGLVEHVCAVHRRARDASVSGRPTLQDGAELINAVAVMCQADLPHGVNLYQEISGDVPVFADRIDVVRVLLNLIHNACQAIGRAGIGGQIVVSGRLVGETAVFTVADDGPGLPPNMRDRVFDFEFTTKQDSGGQGVGLFVSRELAEHNGGSLTAGGSAMGGACFELRVPAHPPRADDDFDDLDDLDTITLESGDPG